MRSPRRPGCRSRDARTLLAKFGLGAEHVHRGAGTLSPGERTRASLALLMANGANLLVLDEPTNHLDLPAIEQLEQALDTFAGTVILVTHDRALLDRVRITRTLDVDHGSVTETLADPERRSTRNGAVRCAQRNERGIFRWSGNQIGASGDLSGREPQPNQISPRPLRRLGADLLARRMRQRRRRLVRHHRRATETTMADDMASDDTMADDMDGDMDDDMMELPGGEATVGDITVTDVWVRQPAEGQTTSAAYGTITNDGDSDITLIGGSVPFDATVEIHETLMDDDGIDADAGARGRLRDRGRRHASRSSRAART